MFVSAFNKRGSWIERTLQPSMIPLLSSMDIRLVTMVSCSLSRIAIAEKVDLKELLKGNPRIKKRVDKYKGSSMFES